MFPMTKGPRNPQLYTKARELRSAGTPYKRIAMALNISPATAFAWTRDIELTAEQEERNRRGPHGPQNPDAQRRRAASWAALCRARRAVYQQKGRERARCGDALHRMGCMLYWAEGGKSRNQLKFANSDPHMVRLFRTFLTDALAIEPDGICISINAYTNNGLSIDEIERFWLDLLDLRPCSLRNHTVNHLPTSSSGRARNRLRYGVCFLVVNRTEAVQHIYGAIQEYAGFEEPRWLD
jgi:hypothetical protein